MGGINSIRNRKAGRTNYCMKGVKKKKKSACGCLRAPLVAPLVQSANRFLIMDNNVIKYAL